MAPADLISETWVRADSELTWQDGSTQLVVSWSSSLHEWCWRAWDLETGKLLGSGSAVGYLQAEGAALRAVPR